MKNEEPLIRDLLTVFGIQKKALDTFIGRYRSLYKGQGMSYKDLRPYVSGDDPKAFVWSKWAQLGQPYVKNFEEERGASVTIAIDISGSMIYANPRKKNLALQAAALLIVAASVSRDKVGLALFSDHLVRFVPPLQGMTHSGIIWQIIETIQPTGAKTDLKNALQELAVRKEAKRGVLCIISDFVSSQPFDTELIVLSAAKDILLFRVFDDFDESMKPPGWIYGTDPETKESAIRYFGKDMVDQMIRFQVKEQTQLYATAAKAKIPICELDINESPLKTMINFFDSLHRFF